MRNISLKYSKSYVCKHYILNLRKCKLFTPQVIFLDYFASEMGIQVYEFKIEVIKSWPIPTNITKGRNFYGLASFYRWFIEDFSSIMAPLTKHMKKGGFEWIKATQRVVESIKEAIFGFYLCLTQF